MLKPLGNRVVVEVAQEEEQTVGGFVLPSSAKEKSQTGVVIAVGEGKLLDSGDRLPLEVNVGDKVLFEKYAGSEIKFDRKDLLVVKESDMVEVIN